ncbi:MAG: MFS transporter [bacterium]|nr:MFS transporter [bacterium]
MAQIAQSAVAPRVGTFTALRQANFRLYFFGQMVSMSGTWMQQVAQGYLVYQLTQSELWLGIVACAAGIPMLLIAPFAGVFVERMPRRRLLIMTGTVQMCLAFILSALVFSDAVQIWHIVTLALLLGTTNAFDAPARQTIISDLVSREMLISGIAMNSMIINGARVFGPAVAGVFLVRFGPAWCFLLNGLSFLAVIGTLFLLQLDRKPLVSGKARPLEQLREGLSYARHNPIVRSLLLLATVGGFFGWAVIALFPAFADEVLRSPESGYALINTALGVGSVIGGVMSASLGAKLGRGRYIVLMMTASSIAALLFSLTRSVPAAVFMCLFAGYALISYFVSLNMTLQTNIAPEFRGRIMSLYTLCIIGFNPFGALVLGLMAEETGTPFALALFAVAFGLLCGLVLVKSPELRRVR